MTNIAVTDVCRRETMSPLFVRGLLDWMLPSALLGAALAASIGGIHMGSHGARWSLGALLHGIYGAFGGATIGAVAWASWGVTQRNNLVAGVASGTLLGLGFRTLFLALYPPLAILIIRLPDPFLPAMQQALVEWVGEIGNATYEVVTVAVIVGCSARLKHTVRIGRS